MAKTKNKVEKDKKKRHKKSGGWFFAALMLFAAVYLFVSFILASGNSFSTVIVKNGEIEDSIFADGYIFKDSSVIYSDRSGFIDCLKADEERVKTNEAVVAVYNDKVNAGLKNEIAEIEGKIASLEKTVSYKSSDDRDSDKIEQSISGNMKKIGALSDLKKIEEISQIRKDISAMLLKKNNINNNDEKAELESLKAQKNSLVAQLNEQAGIIRAPGPGAFTSKVDGAEELLMLSNIKENKVDHNYLDNLKRLDLKNEVSAEIKEGEPVGKIVNNFIWYVACKISAPESELLNVMDSVKVRFTELDENAVNGEITYISPENKGTVVVIVRSNKYVKSLYHTSKTNIQLIKKTYRGIKIPQKAIRIVDDKMGVYVQRGNFAKFIPVEVKYTDADWVIVSDEELRGGIKLYDKVILKGKNLYDQKVIM